MQVTQMKDASFPVISMGDIEGICKRNFRRYMLGQEPQSIGILGPPGGGKTYVFTSPECLPTWYAEYLSERFNEVVTVDDICVIVIRVAEKDGQELAGPGVPFEDENGTFYLRFSRAPTLTEMAEAHLQYGREEPFKYFILVLDELSSSNADVQKVVANMLHSTDRTLGGDLVSSVCTDAFICFTGNMPQDGAGANRLLSHLVDRPKIYRVKHDGMSWITKYAEPHNICPPVIEFMRRYWKDVVVEVPPIDYGNYCTFRSMTETSYDVAVLMDSPDYRGVVPAWAEADWAANIGCKAARMLADFINEMGEVVSPSEIFADPLGAAVSENVGYQYITANMVMGAVTDMSEAESALQYVMRLRTDLIVSIGRKLHFMMNSMPDNVFETDVWQKFQVQYKEYLAV